MNTTAQERKTKAIELLKQLDIYQRVSRKQSGLLL